MTDHDELLARAERWMLSSDYDIETAGKLIRDLAAALRAALAELDGVCAILEGRWIAPSQGDT